VLDGLELFDQVGVSQAKVERVASSRRLPAGDGTVIFRMSAATTHPQSFYGDPRVSADFVGHARERLEAKEQVCQIYFTGCAGDVACGKYNDRANRARDELETRLYAAMEASAAVAHFSPVTCLAWHAEAQRLRPGRF
jgi:hypothetical protein